MGPPLSLGDHHFPVLPQRQRRLHFPSHSLLLIVLVLLLRAFHFASSFAPKSFTKAEKPGPKDVRFYKSCEIKILRHLDVIPEAELLGEEKVTRVRRSNGTSVFYPFGNTKLGQHLFTWTGPKKNRNITAPHSVVIGIPNLDKSPFGWMSGAFIALRRTDMTIEPLNHVADPNKVQKASKETHYYAMVVYARKDLNGILLEWDRWAMSMGRGLESRKAYRKSIDPALIVTQDALLCSYGSCACIACQGLCETVLSKVDLDRQAMKMGQNGPLSKPSRVKGFNAHLLKSAEMMFNSTKARSSKVANTNAFASASTRGGNGTSRATASTHRGTAMAKSVSNSEGGSVAVAKGQIDAVSDVGSVDGADATSLSMTNHGFAQSSSQTIDGGAIQSIAAKSGKSGTKDYDMLDDVDVDKAPDEYEMDEDSIFKDTEIAFEMAQKRTHFSKLIAKGDIAADMCSKENEMVDDMDRLEMAFLLKGAIGAAQTKKSRRANRIAMKKAIFYKDLLRYGLDVDGGVNKSLSLSGKTAGYVIRRGKCCLLNSDADGTDIMDLLQLMGQDCAGLLQDKVDRLQNFSFGQVKRLMQIKKLSFAQHRDLVPMIILRVFSDPWNLSRSFQYISELFSNSTSEKITLSSALLVNAAYFTATKGMAHKIKVFKGLEQNAQSVWAGVLLEYKRCMIGAGGERWKQQQEGVEEDCSELYKERLEIEMNLALGTYLFLKYADIRYSTVRTDILRSPADVFTNFLTLHNLNIAKQVYCKSKRVIAVAAKVREE